MIGLALAIPWMIAVPVYAGWYLDQRFGTSPWLMIIFLAIGLLGAAFDIYTILKRLGQLS